MSGVTTPAARSVVGRAAGGSKIRGEGVRVEFGGVKAVAGVDIVLDQGEILGLIGPNGAGKTTLVNALTGLQRLTAGRIWLDEQDATGWSPQALVRHGLARTFQNVRLYGELSVFQNVEVAALGVGCGRREARERATRLLERIGMSAKAESLGNALPFGEERLLSIARALALSPSLLMLDEPAAGLSESETDDLLTAIRGIRDDFGCGVLVIEHDMRLIMRLCERLHVLDHGGTIANGTPAEVRADPAVIAAYLGRAAGAEGETDA